MSHCPYLLHKFIKTTCLTIILCASFIRVTDCSIRVSQSFIGELQSPCPLGCYTYMILIVKIVEIYNIAAQPYYCWQNNCTARLTYLSSERRHFITSYVQPVMQQYESTTVYKNNFCNQSSHYENYGRFNGSHDVPTTKLTLFVVYTYEWYTKEGCGKSMKNTLYV